LQNAEELLIRNRVFVDDIINQSINPDVSISKYEKKEER
jgi:hypothetical protein